MMTLCEYVYRFYHDENDSVRNWAAPLDGAVLLLYLLLDKGRMLLLLLVLETTDCLPWDTWTLNNTQLHRQHLRYVPDC